MWKDLRNDVALTITLAISTAWVHRKHNFISIDLKSVRTQMLAIPLASLRYLVGETLKNSKVDPQTMGVCNHDATINPMSRSITSEKQAEVALHLFGTKPSFCISSCL